MDGVLSLWPVPLSVLFSLPSPFFSVLLSLFFSTVLFTGGSQKTGKVVRHAVFS